MLKFVVFTILAMTITQHLVKANPYMVWIEGDPQIVSYNKGREMCSFSSPAWLNVLVHQKIFIEAVFSENIYGQASK